MNAWTSHIRPALAVVAERQDLLLVGVLLSAVCMMILPMPAEVADVLIGCNLGISVLLILVAVYLRTPLDFSALPGIILVSTVFRLALEVTVTRLILIHADAGHIVETFGEFVIAGNVAVGLVVFLIITVVQFIVITKGTERVAEVGARFTLDALPGKQMSIDADLRAGDIDQAEAKQRRRTVEKESQLYGAMDGAMKFVKGDAIAGLIIIVVNLIGGIAIGTGQRGMSLGDATHTYILLTVGEALISQIPALLLSITTAIVVTRVTTDGGKDLGRDMVGQLVSDRRALGLAAGVLLGMAFIPGFPVPVFLVLALVFGGASVSGLGPLRLLLPFPGRTFPPGTTDAQRLQESVDAAAPQAEAQPHAFVVIALSAGLHGSIARARLAGQLRLAREQVAHELGIDCPAVAVRLDNELAGTRYAIEIEDVPVERAELHPDRLLLRDDPVHLDLLGVVTEQGAAVFEGRPAFWLHSEHAPRLAAAGIGYSDAAQVMAAKLRECLRRHAPRFIGIQEAKQLVHGLEASFGDLVREATRTVPMARIAEVLRRLLEEGVPVRNMRLILEALVEWGEREKRPLLLAEYVRSALSRQICHQHANEMQVISAFVLEQDAEAAVREALHETTVGVYLALDASVSDSLIEAMRHCLSQLDVERVKPVLIASLDVRRHVRGLLLKNGLNVPVLSYQELAPDFPVQPIGPIGIKGRTAAQRLDAAA